MIRQAVGWIGFLVISNLYPLRSMGKKGEA
jgi:hypothetical protein